MCKYNSKDSCVVVLLPLSTNCPQGPSPSKRASSPYVTVVTVLLTSDSEDFYKPRSSLGSSRNAAEGPGPSTEAYSRLPKPTAAHKKSPGSIRDQTSNQPREKLDIKPSTSSQEPRTGQDQTSHTSKVGIVCIYYCYSQNFVSK